MTVYILISYRTLQGTLIVHGFLMFLFRDENRGEELQNLVKNSIKNNNSSLLLMFFVLAREADC